MDDILYSMYFRKQWNEIRDKLLNSGYDLNRIILVPRPTGAVRKMRKEMKDECKAIQDGADEGSGKSE